jgi:hypothetical protein
MSRRVDRLITHIRNITENDTTNAATDITDNEIIEYINEGQSRLQGRIVAQHPRVFIEETTISSVADQEEYSLPTNAMLASKILSVEYTDDTGADPVYTKLKRGYDRDRASHLSGHPCKYIFRDKMTDAASSILLSPRPSTSSGTIRVQYVRRLDDLDKRRGIISAVTTTSTQLTALTLDTSGDPPIDSDDLDDHDYITIVNKLGVIQMRNIQFDSVDTSTGVVTLTANHTFESGEAAAIGDYIVAGKDTSSHSKLPRSLERYLIQFSAWKIFKRDSSTDSSEALQELLAIEQEVLESYQELNEDDIEIPVIEEWF